jgi:hypothetical protein
LGVDVAASGVGAFLALIAAVILIGIVFYARRTGHLRGRGVVLAVAALVAVLVVYGMTGGFLPFA